MSFEQFFGIPTFDVEKEKQRFIDNMNMLKSMPVEEQTLYKKWYELNHNYTWIVNKASILKARVWRPSNIQNKESTIQELNELEPTLRYIESDDKQGAEDWLLYRILVSSFNFDQNPGRFLRYLLEDAKTGKVLGVASLGSDVISIGCRDRYIGWTKEQKHAGMLGHTAIGTTIVATQPFGYNFLGGKLLASMLTTKQVRDRWQQSYNQVLAGMTTTSLYGSHSMYQRIPWWKELGTSMGRVPIKPDDDLFHLWKNRIIELHPDKMQSLADEGDDSGPSTGIKQKTLQLIFNEVGIKAGHYAHGFERGVYFSQFYDNTCEFLTEKIPASELKLNAKFKDDVAGVMKWWREKAIRRYENLHASNRLNDEVLFYNRMIGMSWEDAKNRYLSDVGR